ncbi:MAG: LuxR C-terminal-related transcriptional regulator [Hyphomonas sp.]
MTSGSENEDPPLIMAYARAIDRIGREIGLPYIAVSADISNPAPMLGPDGRPLAETLFRWVNPDFAYWKDRSFALRAGLLSVVRVCGEPFFYSRGKLQSWRSVRALEDANMHLDPASYDRHGIAAAIICPIHSPLGIIGAVVWATGETGVDVEGIFRARAPDMFLLALRFLSAYLDQGQPPGQGEAVEFTRRENQCLKWAAAGKTDSEVATIMNVSVPTVRFHMTNASRKLGVSGRSHTIRLATTLGYIGPT